MSKSRRRNERRELLIAALHAVGGLSILIGEAMNLLFA